MKSAPAPNIIYPSIGFKVPTINLLIGFFKATNPIKDIKPNKKAGFVNISFPITPIKPNIIYSPLKNFYLTKLNIASSTSSFIFFLFV